MTMMKSLIVLLAQAVRQPATANRVIRQAVQTVTMHSQVITAVVRRPIVAVVRLAVAMLIPVVALLTAVAATVTMVAVVQRTPQATRRLPQVHLLMVLVQ